MATCSPQDVLRRTDNALLAEYFDRHELLTELKINERKQTNMVPVYEAILELEPAVRGNIERDLRSIALMAEKRMIQHLHKALQYEAHTFPEFKKQRANFDRAMWALVNHQDIFEKVLAYSFPHTEIRHWQRYECDESSVPDTGEAACERLSQRIGQYFRELDGRGEHCRVEHHSFQENEYLFAYPSDYPDQLPEWLDNGEFDRVPHHLAFVVIFVFPKAGGWVDVYIKEPIAVSRELVKIWAKEIADLDNIDTRPKRSYDLTPFRSRESNIVIPPESPVIGFSVQKVYFSPSDNPRVTYEVKSPVDQNHKAIYDELGGRRLPIGTLRRVGLEVV